MLTPACLEALLARHGETLRAVAGAAIDTALAGTGRYRPDSAAFPAALAQHGASFVTLKRAGALRGCIGSIEAQAPLIEDVADNAQGAAFRDPRFAPLSAAERSAIDIQISVLTTPEPIAFHGEAALLAALRPGRDGVIIGERGRRAVFLPVVWEMLPAPPDFLAQLKRKAGLPDGYWSDAITALRFEARSLG